MRIMLLTPVNEIFGERFLQLLLDAGHIVTFVGDKRPIDTEGPDYNFFPYPGVFRTQSRFAVVNRAVALLRLYYLKLIWRLTKPDIVHVHWIDFRAIDCVRANCHPLILTAWGSDINNLFVPGIFTEQHVNKVIESLTLSDHITADAVDIIQKCASLTGKHLSTSLLYLGIDFDTFKPGYVEDARTLRHEFGIQPEERVILSIRGLKPIYGHHYILDAFAEMLSESRHQNVRLVLKRSFVHPNDYEEQLRAQAQQLGVADYIIWIEMLPDEKMPVLYAISDVVVSYPEQDAFPVSFLEAAACKRPVISSILPAYSGVFPPDTFWMVPSKNSHELSHAMRMALDASSSEIERRVNEAYAVAWQIGDWNQSKQAVNQLYCKVVGS